jgi:hypothetical protein
MRRADLRGTFADLPKQGSGQLYKTKHPGNSKEFEEVTPWNCNTRNKRESEQQPLRLIKPTHQQHVEVMAYFPQCSVAA